MLLEKDVKPSRKRAVIYCRVSTDKQEVDGESLEYQEAKCRSYAELHDMDVIIVLLEAKSGFIHYSLREKLTIARQFIRDGLADVIIVFDLRRFSRNFVHSAMIFEEIESHGGEIVSCLARTSITHLLASLSAPYWRGAPRASATRSSSMPTAVGRPALRRAYRSASAGLPTVGIGKTRKKSPTSLTRNRRPCACRSSICSSNWI